MAGGFSVIPPQNVVAIGPKGPYADGTPQSTSLDPHGNTLASQYEAPYRMLQKYKQTFFACNQADTTWTVGFAAGANTGFALFNPITGKKNLEILRIGFILNAAPAVASSIGLAQGFYSPGFATVTALSTYDGQKGLPASQATGLASAAFTIPAGATAVVYRQWLLGGFTGTVLPSPNNPVIDEAGLIELVPGGWLEIAAVAAVHGMAFCEWAEVDP